MYNDGPRTSQGQVVLNDVVLEELATTSEVMLLLLNSYVRTALTCREIACAVLRGLTNAICH